MSPSATLCPSCGQTLFAEPFYRCGFVPTNSVLLCDTHEQAVSMPRGSVSLVFCSSCSLIFNREYDPGLCLYNERYEETQSHSEVFNSFHRDLAGSLLHKYGLQNKTILEIGCGKGDFLHFLCRTGDNRGIGFDPAYVQARTCTATADGVTIHPQPFPPDYQGPPPDCIICKMTLEHISQVRSFLENIRAAIPAGDDPILFFQVPDTEPILAEARFWDIYYEHCTYFTPSALVHLFQGCGFRVLEISSVYHGQYLVIEAKPTDRQRELPDASAARAEIARLVDSFSGEITAYIRDWRSRLRHWSYSGNRVVLWGGGSKAVAFLTTLGTVDEVQLVVDINPHKQDKYLPGTGHRVVGPAELIECKPDVILVMNPAYLEEIRNQVQGLGLGAKVIPLTNAVIGQPVQEGP